jgi:hypothetical protein
MGYFLADLSILGVIEVLRIMANVKDMIMPQTVGLMYLKIKADAGHVGNLI